MEGILRCRLEPIFPKDGDQIMEIYNYYVEDSFAAFPERKVPLTVFQPLYERGPGLSLSDSQK
jgi:L-amino acid N-acyltransferase YncA